MVSADRIAREFADIPRPRLIVGTYVSTNVDGTVQLDFGSGAVTCQSAGFFDPLPGDSVRCLQLGADTVMLGPAFPKLAIGKVTGTGTPAMAVTVNGVPLQLPFLSSYTPRTIGDDVLIDWSSGGVVVGKLSAIPAGSYTPPVAPGTPFSANFYANDSGSYESGSWNKLDVYCSASNIGAWFYGNTIADTIPDTATINRVQVYVPEFFNQFPTSLATIGVHTLLTKSGAPVVSFPNTISAGSGWKDLDPAFGVVLANGSYKGIGTNHGGFHKFRSRAADANSGLLRIDWTV